MPKEEETIEIVIDDGEPCSTPTDSTTLEPTGTHLSGAEST